MTNNTRKRRGRDTERILADHLRQHWPHATANAPGAAGPDILNTPGAAIEAKARRGLDLPAWLRQTGRNTQPGDLPVLVVRTAGQGPATVGQWAAVVHLDDLLHLLGKEHHCNASPSASTPPTSPPSDSPADSYAHGTTRTSQPGPATTNSPNSASNSTE